MFQDLSPGPSCATWSAQGLQVLSGAWPNSYNSTRVEIGGPSSALWRPVPAAGRAGATPVALAVVLQTRRVADVRERDEGAPAGHLLRQSTVQQSSVDTQNTALPSP